MTVARTPAQISWCCWTSAPFWIAATTFCSICAARSTPAFEQDLTLLGDSLEGLGCLPRGATPEARQLFADFCLQLLEPLRPPERLPPEYLNADGEYCWGKSRLMHRAGKKGALSATSRHFTPPSREFALIARKLTGVFTFIAVLEAEFNAYDSVAAHIARWREREGHGER